VADEQDAFQTLLPSDIELLQAQGTRRPITRGEYLYRAGDASYDFYVILSGSVDILTETGGTERIIATHGPGRFLGELNLLTDLRVFVSARVAESGEALVVPRKVLQELIATHARIGDTILSAFLARRSILLDGAASAIQILGSRFSPPSLRIREFLIRSHIPHQWLDPDDDALIQSALDAFDIRPGDLPVVVVAGTMLRNATPGSMAEYLGLTLTRLPDRSFDLIVVGAGPAGLAAAVYAASEGLTILNVETAVAGGQAGSTSRIENYLGFPVGISGIDLTQRAVAQAEKFGARLVVPCTAMSVHEDGTHLVVSLADGTDVFGRAVMAATGARYRRLNADGLDDFEGKGVYYAATDIEARLCAGGEVVVVGGGNSAGQAALYLADSGSEVKIVIRSDDLSKSMSRYLIDRIESTPRIAVLPHSMIVGLDGDEVLHSVRLRDLLTGTEVTSPCCGLFSFIGAEPCSFWLEDFARLDKNGFVLTDRLLGRTDLGAVWDSLTRTPLPFETSQPGLFAVGDLRSGSLKRVAAAVGEGSSAVRSVHDFLGSSG
jgi:thioredoxin reductase (NADPH)